MVLSIGYVLHEMTTVVNHVDRDRIAALETVKRSPDDMSLLSPLKSNDEVCSKADNRAGFSSVDEHGYTPLHRAAENGHGVDINIQDRLGKTALHYATENGYCDGVELLINSGADIGETDKNKRTLLHCASENGHCKVMETLVKRGVEVDEKDEKDRTALHCASKTGNRATVELLLNEGADISAKDADGCTAIHYAAEEGRCSVLELLLDRGADLAGKQSKHGWTALHCAARKGHCEAVSLLLDKGAEVDEKDKNNRTALLLAAHRRPLAMRLLLERGASVDHKGNFGQTALHLSALTGCCEAMTLLLDHGADVNVKDSKGWAAIDFAAMNGHMAAIRLLSARGADLNGFNKAMLHHAAYGGYCDVINLLLDRGADVNRRENGNLTPLHDAATSGHHDAIRLLLERGADLEAQDDSNMTPLGLASLTDAADAFKLLLSHGADVNVKNVEGVTPLHSASAYGSYNYVVWLLERGARVNVQDNLGFTPLHYGVKNWAIVEKLLRKDKKTIQGRTPLHHAAHPCIDSAETVELLLLAGANSDAVDERGKKPIDLAEKNSKIKVILSNHRKCYPDLQRLCRMRIRSLFGRGGEDKVDALPLPHTGDGEFSTKDRDIRIASLETNIEDLRKGGWSIRWRPGCIAWFAFQNTDYDVVAFSKLKGVSSIKFVPEDVLVDTSMALNDPKKSTENNYLRTDHGYEDVDLKLGSGNVILLSGLKRATPPELPPRNVGMGGTPVVRPESMGASPSREETQGDGHKVTVDKEYEDMDQKDTDGTYKDGDQKHGSQRDSPSEHPTEHLDVGDKEEERTERQDEQEKFRGGEPATVKWTKAKALQVCLFIFGCGLLAIFSVKTGNLLSPFFISGSKEADNSTNQPNIIDAKQTNEENSLAKVNLASASKPEVQFWFNNPRMTMSAEEISSESTVAFSTSALSSTLQLQIFSTSPMMILDEGDSSTVGYSTLQILAHGGESTELSTDISGHTVLPLYPVIVSPSVTVTCERGWHGYNKHCYKLEKGKLTWFKARKECKKHGANPASILSQEENNFIEDLINDVDVKCSSKQVWIGLHNKDGWTWSGTHGAGLTYTNWAPEEPSGKSWLGREENCGAMYTKIMDSVRRRYSPRTDALRLPMFLHVDSTQKNVRRVVTEA
ncbi:hypothetical protein Bbelb_261330 [Branchiostoma belcheri]|nr:hypothetical protein Bbelb_261330 [Branchiostoma belcheri]